MSRLLLHVITIRRLAEMAGVSCRRENAGRKKGGKSLVVRDGEIGIVNSSGTFHSYTNFCMEIVNAVRSPDGAPSLYGYVYNIQTTSGVQKYVSMSTAAR